MTCKTDTTSIDGYEISVTQWPAEKAVLMKFRLTKVLGSSILKLASLVRGKTTEDEKIKAFSESLDSLFQNANPDELSTLVKDCVVGAACDGKVITQQGYNEFTGEDLPTLYKIMFFTIKVNFPKWIPSRMEEKFRDNLNSVMTPNKDGSEESSTE